MTVCSQSWRVISSLTSTQEVLMFKITGLEEFQRKIEQMRRNAEQLDGEHQVPMTDLFSPA
jgi:hypothetical protein